ncbi:unnamed protein product [Orchesella dallaii]|uniref:Uncharacterized protein n=1 Tax=Orchesella dallaii TaxID=48710 RepID=A0ABP1PNF2_9HEXA
MTGERILHCSCHHHHSIWCVILSRVQPSKCPVPVSVSQCAVRANSRESSGQVSRCVQIPRQGQRSRNRIKGHEEYLSDNDQNLKMRRKDMSHPKPSAHSLLSVDATTVASSVVSAPTATTIGGGGDTILEDVPSVNSMQELVAFDEEGHPYIDINKLSFKPKKKHHERLKEKLSWYVPDFSFIVFNFMSLGCSTYFILIGNTTLTWKASVGMFSLPNCYAIHGFNFTNGSRIQIESDIRPNDFFYTPCETFLYEPPFWNEAYQTPGEGYNFSVSGSHPILRTKLTNVHYFGLVLICISLLNIMNTCVGINACLHGYKTILIGHIAVDGVIVLIEFIVCAAVHFTGHCEAKDIEIIRVVLRHFIQWYGVMQKQVEFETAKEKLLTSEIDSLQIGLGCCGADGWQDYLASSQSYLKSTLPNFRSDMDETESVIPFSCCRPWWIRNIYCANGAHLWGHPMASAAKAFQFHERINQESCTYKLEKMCFKIKSLLGVQGFITTFFHMFFTTIEAVAAFVLIQNINTLIIEKKKAMKQKEISNEPGDSDDDDDDALEPVDGFSDNIRKSRGAFTRIPPPTEDEIVTIKQRSNFNKFIAKADTSHVGSWMRQARDKVTAGHEDEDSNQLKLTAAEKKAREKELLHRGKGRNDDDANSLEDLGHHRHHHRHHRHTEKFEALDKEELMHTPGRPKGGVKKMAVKLDKIKSKLDTGHVIKRKSRKSGWDEEHQKRKSERKSHVAPIPPEEMEEPPHMDDEGFRIDEETGHKINAVASKYEKQKGAKFMKKGKLPAVAVPSNQSILRITPKKSGKAQKSVRVKPHTELEKGESTTVLWKKGDGVGHKDGGEEEEDEEDEGEGAEEGPSATKVKKPMGKTEREGAQQGTSKLRKGMGKDGKGRAVQGPSKTSKAAGKHENEEDDEHYEEEEAEQGSSEANARKPMGKTEKGGAQQGPSKLRKVIGNDAKGRAVQGPSKGSKSAGKHVNEEDDEDHEEEEEVSGSSAGSGGSGGPKKKAGLKKTSKAVSVKQKPSKAPTQSRPRRRRSGGSTDWESESGVSDSEIDDDENSENTETYMRNKTKSKKKSRSKSRRKRIRAAKKKREKEIKRPKHRWFNYF